MRAIELFNSKEALSKLIKLDLHIKKSYELRKFIIEATDKLRPFEESRNDLIKKYWKQVWDDIIVEKKDYVDFSKDLQEIDEEIEITIPELTIDDIDWKISTETLIQLSYLIK